MTTNARVLVADGEERIRTDMFRALLDRGIFCDCAASGGDAIERLAGTSYALIVLDFSLPHTGAVAVIESVRAMPPAQQPMVIATGSIEVAPDSDLVQMIFRRPLRIRDVADVIEACLAQVRTAWDAPRSAVTARSINRSGTST
jgi:CheY-like chemotaxis protein